MKRTLPVKGYKFFLIVLMVVFPLILMTACDKEEGNPYIPDVYIDFTLDPNSTFYQELNTVGGWMYLTSELPSRGIIVYRADNMEFMAYDRMPPNDPNRCCTNNVCTRLLVDDYYPFVMDTCTNISYLLLNGSIFEGEGKYPLIRYNTSYNGQLLRIYN